MLPKNAETAYHQMPKYIAPVLISAYQMAATETDYCHLNKQTKILQYLLVWATSTYLMKWVEYANSILLPKLHHMT